MEDGVIYRMTCSYCSHAAFGETPDGAERISVTHRLEEHGDIDTFLSSSAVTP